jgi:hypothetical protein
MERYDTYSDRIKGPYYDSFIQSDQVQNYLNFGRSLGRKRLFTVYHAMTGADEDARPDYDETDLLNIGDPFDENSSTGSFRLTSYNDNEWTVYVFGYNTNTFSHIIDFEGKHLWIGSLENTQLTNGLHTILVNDFSNLVKSGVYKNETNERLFKENVYNRDYNLNIDEGTLYFKMNSLLGSQAMNIGKNNYVMRTQRIVNTQNKIFIAVKYGTVLFNKIPASQVTYSDWGNDKYIEVDASEYDVLFSSPYYSSSLQQKYNQLNIQYNTGNTHWSSLVYDASLFPNTFTFLTQNVPLTRSYIVGLEERENMFVRANNSYLQIASTPSIKNRNETVFNYYDDPDSFHLGNTQNYASVYTTSDTVISPTLRNSVLVKNTILAFTPSDVIPDWASNFSHVFNSGGTIGSDVYNFFNDPDSGMKAKLDSPNPNDTAASYYAPSKNIGPNSINNTASLAFEFDLPGNGENVYLGVINQSDPNVTTTSTFEPSTDLRVNLSTGAIEIQGQVVGNPLIFDDPSVVIMTLTYLDNGNILANIGTSENNMQTFTLQTMGGLTDPRFYLSGNNLGDGTLGVFKQIPIEALVGETNDIPNEIVYSPSDISNMGDIFNEGSTTGTFTITSNSLTEWTILVLDTSFNVLAGQTVGSGVEMYLGVFHGSVLPNGLNTVLVNNFNAMNKSGVNFQFTPQYSQKIYKENVFSRDLDMFITPTLYFKLTDVTTSTCFSIGVDNYHCRNIKLANTPNKFFFAVRKGEITFTKIAASTLIKSGWNNISNVDVDATDYDVEFSDVPFSNTVGGSDRIVEQTNNLTDFCDMYFSSNTNTNTFTFRDANSTISDYYVKNIGKISGTLNKNGTELAIGNSISTLIGSNYFFRYNSDHSSVLKKNVFMGSSQVQYVSCYLDNDISLTMNVRFSIVFKSKVFTLNLLPVTDIWPSLISENFTSTGTVGSPITNALSVLAYNTKNLYSYPSSTSGTLYLPSVYVGSGSLINPVSFCFEFNTSSDVILGIMNRTLTYSEITNTFESSSVATMNLTSGVCFINGTTSTKAFGNSEPRVFVVSCRKLPEGLLVSIGSSGENATQGTLIPNVSFDNVCLYVTGNTLVNGHIVTLKRITLPGLTGYTDEIPTQPQVPPTSLPGPSFSPFTNSNNLSYNAGETVTVTSTANEWKLVKWRINPYPTTHFTNEGSYGNYSFVPYNNQTMEWRVGISYGNSTLASYLNNTVVTLNDSEVNSATGFPGTYIKIQNNGILTRSYPAEGGGAFKTFTNTNNLLFAVVVGRPVYLPPDGQVSYLLCGTSFTDFHIGPYYNPHPYSNPSSDPYKVDFFIAVKYGALTYTKRSWRDVISKVAIVENEGDEAEFDTLCGSYPFFAFKGIPRSLNSVFTYGLYIDLTIGDMRLLNCGYILLNSNSGGFNFNFNGSLTEPFQLSSSTDSFNFNRFLWMMKHFSYYNYYDYINSSNTQLYQIRSSTTNFITDTTHGLNLPSWGSDTFPPTTSSMFMRIISSKEFGDVNTRYSIQMGWDDQVVATLSSVANETVRDRCFPFICFNNQSISPIQCKGTIKYHDVMDNSRWLSNSYYTFDSTTNNSALNDYFRNNNQITTRKIKFMKSHSGSSVTFRSPINNANTIFMQYELYSNTDVYFGIVTDVNPANTGSWEYSQSYTDPSTMIAYVNLNTRQAVVGPNTIPPLSYTFENRNIKVLAVSFTKSSTTANFQAFNHHIAPVITKGVTTPGHTSGGYRYVITCNNVTDDNIIVFNNFTAS